MSEITDPSKKISNNLYNPISQRNNSVDQQVILSNASSLLTPQTQENEETSWLGKWVGKLW